MVGDTEKPYEHTEMTKNPRVHSIVLYLLGLGPDPSDPPISSSSILQNSFQNKFNEEKSKTTSLAGASLNEISSPRTSFYTTILGVGEVNVTDDKGNGIIRENGAFFNNVEGLKYETIGENALFLSTSVNRTYTIEAVCSLMKNRFYSDNGLYN